MHVIKELLFIMLLSGQSSLKHDLKGHANLLILFYVHIGS